MPGLYNRGLIIGKVLIANRGEIAIRIMRTLREMDVRSVAVYSEVDRAALHVRGADEAIAIDNYLNIPGVINAAKESGADAIHPGYGFLSENARFAQAVADAGLTFIGPSPKSISMMGSKTEARRIAKAAGTPVIPGTEEGLLDAEEALRFSTQVGYPVMLKAVAGGGGKGMRRVDREADLISSFEVASSEAARAFGDGRIYVERLIERARHIEIQVLGDQHGNLIHLGERECSIQRRHQKIVEECPSPWVARHPGLRERMGEAALKAARAAGYYNAGTVEFLADTDGHFYFLEMNTRLQVEHPVTEMVTGLDLVRIQVNIAAGDTLPLTQADVRWNGHAIECRIYAEDPANNFFPSPGRIVHLTEPAGPGIRVDSTLYQGWTVPIDYDPILAKLVAWAGSREHARLRLLRAIHEYRLIGIESNVWFFDFLLNELEFREADLHTGYLDELIARKGKFERRSDPALARVAATVLAGMPVHSGNAPPPNGFSKWSGRVSPPVAPLLKRTRGIIRIDGEIASPLPNANITQDGAGAFSVLLGSRSYDVRTTDDLVTVDGLQMRYEIEDAREWKGAGQAAGGKGIASIKASMPGKIVKVLVAPGEDVEAGQGIVFIEAMKMQNELKAPKAGRVATVKVKAHDSVTAGQILATIE